jgi:hypothetical protein
MTYTDTNAELAAYEADERENDYFKLIWAMNTLANTTKGMTTAPTKADADAWELPAIMLKKAASHVPKAFPDTLALMLRAWGAPAGIDGDALRAEARAVYQALSEAEADLWRRAEL